MLGAFRSQSDLGMTYGGGCQNTIFGGYLYRFSGQALVGGVAQASDNFILSAKILEDGSLAPFKVIGTGLPAWGSPHLVTLGSTVFLIGGGATGTTQNSVLRYKLEPGGNISAPFSCPRTSIPFAALRGFTQIGEFFYGMGTSSAGFNSIDLWAFKITQDGVSGKRLDDFQVGPLASRTFIGHRGYLYSVGGINTSGGTRLNDIWAAKASGYHVGPWKLIGSLPVAVSQIPLIVIDDTLLVIGGRTAAGTSTGVYAAKLGLGTIGSFSLISSLPTGVFNSQNTVVATSKHVYLPGGSDGSLVSQNIIQYAPILRGP